MLSTESNNTALTKRGTEKLLFCPNCGSPAKDYDKFCSYCGKPLYAVTPENMGASFGYPPKPSTNLSNGIAIGACGAVVIFGLVLVFTLNSVYWSQLNLLISKGLDPNLARYELFTLSEIIPFAGAGVFLGAYLLTIISLIEFNPKIRGITSQKGSTKVTLGKYATNLGPSLIAITILNSLTSAYQSYPSDTLYLNIGFGAAGAIIAIIGVLLFYSFYHDSKNLAKKFIEQTSVPVKSSERL